MVDEIFIRRNDKSLGNVQPPSSNSVTALLSVSISGPESKCPTALNDMPMVHNAEAFLAG